jgi:hypothetical protein
MQQQQKKEDPSWIPEGAKVTLITTSFKPPKHPSKSMSIPLDDNKHNKKTLPYRPKIYFVHFCTLWSCIFFLFIFTLFNYYKINSISSLPTSLNQSSLRHDPKNIKVYPFNIYDDTKDKTVRYPSTGGIPELDWDNVKFFRVCCKDEDHLKCFAANEVVLRRDSERTTKKLPDVYMEVKHATSANVAEIGSRCNLIWSTEKAKVES